MAGQPLPQDAGTATTIRVVIIRHAARDGPNAATTLLRILQPRNRSPDANTYIHICFLP